MTFCKALELIKIRTGVGKVWKDGKPEDMVILLSVVNVSLVGIC